MTVRAVALLGFLAVITAPAGAALDDFIPGESLLLDPVAVDGLFAFNDIIIGETVVVSIDRSVWGDQTVTLSAAGDISVYGALDAGIGPLALHTPNNMLLDGRIYGDSLPVEAGSFSWINNPNGNDDIHWTGGVLTTLIPDGPLPLEFDSTSGSFDSTSGSMVSWSSGGMMWESGVVTEWSGLDEVRAVFSPFSPDITPVPLPPAVLLFGGAVLALSARLRRSV